MGVWVDVSGEVWARESLHDSDSADKVAVKVPQLFSGNPGFLVRATRSVLNWVAGGERVIDLELGDEADIDTDGISVACNLAGISAGRASPLRFDGSEVGGEQGADGAARTS